MSAKPLLARSVAFISESLESRRLLSGATYSTDSIGLPLLTSTPPGSNAVTLFIDFNGEVTSSKTYLPFETDGNTASFSAAEQAAIYDTWRAVVSAYSAFNVRVTTDQSLITPGDSKTAWMIVSGSNSGTNAYPNSIDGTIQGFALNSNATSASGHMGIAHEFGHMFGLYHQSKFDDFGVQTDEYLNGYDDTHGALSGSSFANPLVKWYLGTRDGGSGGVIQDDLSVIAGTIVAKTGTGDGFRTDDYSDTISTTLTATNGKYQVDGIIERLTDIDYFKFASTGGRYALATLPTFESGLAPKFEVLDSSGTILATADSTGYRTYGSKNYIDNGQDLTIDLPAGNYYVKVRSHGDYNDLGEYRFIASKLPDANYNTGDVTYEGNGKGGYTTYDSSTDTITVGASGTTLDASGNQNASTSVYDDSRFVYKVLTGDGSVTTKLTGLVNAQETGLNTFSHAGVEIRQDLSITSPMAELYARGGGIGGMRFSSRNVGTTLQSFGSVNSSYGIGDYLRLVRTGNTITAYASHNGTTWSGVLYTTTVTLSGPVYIGVSSNSGSQDDLAQATFQGTTFTGNVTTPTTTINALTPPVLSSVLRPTTGDVTLTDFNVDWNATTGATGYRVERSIDGVNFTAVGDTTSAVTVLKDDPGFGVMRYFYRVRAKSPDGLFSAPSNILAWTNRPNVPGATQLRTIKFSQTQITVEWSDVSGETGYEVQRSSDGGSTFATAGTVGANTRFYVDSGLTSGTEYVYRVRSLHSSFGNSGWTSNINSGTKAAAPTGLTITGATSSALTVNWPAVSGATSYVLQRSTTGASNSFTDLITLGGSATSYTNSSLSALSEYYYRLVVYKGVTGMVRSDPSAATFAATKGGALPSGWAGTDLGNAAGGASGYSSGTYTVIGSGSSALSGTTDNAQFAYKALTGDFTIIAKVNSMEATGSYAKAGVMVRQSLDADAKAVLMSHTTGGTEFGRRTGTGFSPLYTYGPDSLTVADPVWVKLTRVAGVFAGYQSYDGINWTQVSSTSITMTGTVYVGLAVTAYDSSELNTATFSNVSIV